MNNIFRKLEAIALDIGPWQPKDSCLAAFQFLIAIFLVNVSCLSVLFHGLYSLYYHLNSDISYVWWHKVNANVLYKRGNWYRCWDIKLFYYNRSSSTESNITGLCLSNLIRFNLRTQKTFYWNVLDIFVVL